ncbi:disulfide bond formation protein B [Agrobacterium sp. FDAARGOS_525]|uniref:disulfide bond formation protein B n=1 Tax=Agrobacterium sp. FDAARGOS_525 TaxID=2420311 RepID=UPI00256EEC19|nr:disulfide bond formation protein B [Agrobacterium sp. FDAARGOS_525]
MVKTNDGAWLAIFSAWIIAMGSTLGALFIGEVMGQAPCDLCWHQRAFMFPLAVLLAVAAFRSDARAWIYAVPLAAAGWSIAAFHNLLYFNIIPRPSSLAARAILLGRWYAPLRNPAHSAAVAWPFTVIIVLLLIVRRRTPT